MRSFIAGQCSVCKQVQFVCVLRGLDLEVIISVGVVVVIKERDAVFPCHLFHQITFLSPEFFQSSRFIFFCSYPVSPFHYPTLSPVTYSRRLACRLEAGASRSRQASLPVSASYPRGPRGSLFTSVISMRSFLPAASASAVPLPGY